MVTREEVKEKVIQLLSVVSNMVVDKDREESNLKSDLLLAQRMIDALAGPYTRISKEFDGAMITLTEAGKADTVKAVIDLIWGKIPQANKIR